MRFLHPSRFDPLPKTAGRRCPTKSRTTPWGGIETVIHPGRAEALGYTCATSSLPLLKPTTTDLRNLPGGSAATRLPAHRIPRQGTCLFCRSKSNSGADTAPPPTAGADVDPVLAVASFSNGEASMSAVGRHHNRVATGPVKPSRSGRRRGVGAPELTKPHPRVRVGARSLCACALRRGLEPVRGRGVDDGAVRCRKWGRVISAVHHHFSRERRCNWPHGLNRTLRARANRGTAHHARVTVRRMGTTFHGPSPWPHITRAIRVRGPRHAAIAYLGEDAPALLPLRAGDLLVVNASRAAVRAHVTSPIALA
jgi:hypothetical protein